MESVDGAVLKIAWVIVKEGVLQDPPLGLKRMKHTLSPIGVMDLIAAQMWEAHAGY